MGGNANEKFEFELCLRHPAHLIFCLFLGLSLSQILRARVPNSLADFLGELLDDYGHYGGNVRAITAAAADGARVIERCNLSEDEAGSTLYALCFTPRSAPNGNFIAPEWRKVQRKDERSEGPYFQVVQEEAEAQRFYSRTLCSPPAVSVVFFVFYQLGASSDEEDGWLCAGRRGGLLVVGRGRVVIVHSACSPGQE
jgi:hypothetical protein